VIKSNYQIQGNCLDGVDTPVFCYKTNQSS